MEKKDYYEILAVETSADLRAIKEAYRRLAFQYHPDRNNSDPGAVEKMKEINEAYAVLSDTEKRARYDLLRRQYGSGGYDRFRQAYSEQDIFRGSDIGQIFEEMARSFGFRNFQDVFRECYGEGVRSYEFRRPGVFGRVIIFGRTGGRQQREQDAVPHGASLSGAILGRVGRYLLERLVGAVAGGDHDVHAVIEVTPEMATNGGKVKYVEREASRELVITIPPGIRDGQTMRLRGQGRGSRSGGGTVPGDLYLHVRVKRTLSVKIRDLLGLGLPSR